MPKRSSGPPTGPPPATLPELPSRSGSPVSIASSVWEEEDYELPRPQTAIHLPTQSVKDVMQKNMRVSQENLLRSISAEATVSEQRYLKGFLSEMFHAYLSWKVVGGPVTAKVRSVDDIKRKWEEKMKDETLHDLYYRYREANPLNEDSFKAFTGLPRRIFEEVMWEWDTLCQEGTETYDDEHLDAPRFLLVVGRILERFMENWKPRLVLPTKSYRQSGKQTSGTATPKAPSSKQPVSVHNPLAGSSSKGGSSSQQGSNIPDFPAPPKK